jgi:hypothetical protein
LPLKLLLADTLEVRDRYLRTGAGTGHIERQQVFVRQGILRTLRRLWRA